MIIIILIAILLFYAIKELLYEMSADINHAFISCFSVIICDYCKTRGRLFNKHRILCINNNPFHGTRSH